MVMSSPPPVMAPPPPPTTESAWAAPAARARAKREAKAVRVMIVLLKSFAGIVPDPFAWGARSLDRPMAFQERAAARQIGFRVLRRAFAAVEKAGRPPHQGDLKT